MEMKELAGRDDVRILVDSFYKKVKEDPLLGPVFAHVNWPQHLPVMYNFWSSVLFAENNYHGNPLKSHMHLPLEQKHFSRWLELFSETLSENFTGGKADEAGLRAKAIAQVFQSRMGLNDQVTVL
jgi:hemoglobin